MRRSSSGAAVRTLVRRYVPAPGFCGADGVEVVVNKLADLFQHRQRGEGRWKVRARRGDAGGQVGLRGGVLHTSGKEIGDALRVLLERLLKLGGIQRERAIVIHLDA